MNGAASAKATQNTDTVFIDVARDFSPTPGGRYERESKWSGEEFRIRLLEPALRAGKRIVVDLDGAVGFTTSFLEEAFGGLVRTFGKEVIPRVTITANVRPARRRKAIEYIERAIGAAG